MNTKNLILAITLLCSIFTGFGQDWSEDFNSQISSSYTTGSTTINSRVWTSQDAGNFSYANTKMGSPAFTINDNKSGAHITTPILNTCGTVSFKYAYINGNSNNVFQLQVSTDGTSFTTLDTHTLGASSNLSYVAYSFDINNSSSTTYVRILSDNQDAHLFVEDFSVTSYSASTPTITVSPTSLTGLDYSEGLGPSAEQFFTVEGTNLTNDIVLTAPTNYEISLTTGGSFVATNPITLTQSGGTVTSTIYVRLASGLAVNTYSGNITATSTGATTQNVAVSGEVIQPVITLTPTSLTGLDYVFGSGPSAEQTFAASGVNLSGNIILSAPTNFEISESSGSGFGTTVTLTPISETVLATTIYVRLASGLAVNTYGPSNITANSNFATTKNVAVSGEVTAASSTCSELFISEYVEGSGNNKFIEIYNPTASVISLTGYEIEIYVNGSSTGSTPIPLSGSIAAYDVFVFANSSADFVGLGVTADSTSGSLTFNGDDAVALRNSGTIIDVIGQIGFDPGSQWTGTVCTQGTADGTLVRNSTVQAGDANGSDSFNPDTEWTCANINVISNLGSHTSDCAVTSPTITVSANSLIGLDYVFGSGPSAEQTFTVSGSDLTTDIDLTAPTNFEISTTSGGVFGSALTLTQTGSVVSTITIYVRLVTGLSINVYTGNLTATSTGATAKNITFDGEVTCVPTHTITNFAPASGSIGTEVTITGTGFSATSTVTFDGTNATILSQTTSTLVVEVPTGATTYLITVTEAGCSLNSSSNFTVLSDNGCVGGTIPAGWTDLMFTGIYDDPVSSCHYLELFNPTASDIDLSAYTIGFDNNFTYGSAVPTSGFTGGSITLSGTIAAESTFMVQVSSSGVCNTCSTIIPDLTFANGGINIDDRLVLLNGVLIQDVWQNHSSRPSYDITYVDGYIYSRDVATTAPSTTFDIADWSTNGTESCFGFALSSATLPTVNTQPADTSGCFSAAFTVAATAGSGGALSYQWKYNDGTALGWSDVVSTSFLPGTVTGENSANLSVFGFDLDGYQFYCEVTEDVSCSVSSNAAQVTTQTTSWNGITWSVPPSISTVAVINGNYSTVTNGNFSACSLIVNAGFNLTVDNSTYVEVENDVVVNGTIVVETQGSFVQNNDDANFTVNSGGSASVNKTTAPLNNWYEYTYWSSPVFGETIGNALAPSPVSRRFWFNAQNYLDATAETANDNATDAGQDGIDDNGDDWQYAASDDVMIPGVGYAATQSSAVLSQYNYTFTGPFNNGVITVPVYRNDDELFDENSNFIGNPYASAIDVDAFFNTNVNSLNASGVLDGPIYLWSHNTAPSTIANGNETQNFAQSDYAIINGAALTAGGDGVTPNRYIPSGQGFFTSFSDDASATVVSGTIKTGDVIFNNSMRVITGNDQFFKTSNKNRSNTLENKIWINLTSNNGVFNQLAVAYINGATNADDGSYYDAKRSIPRGMGAIIYSLIEGSEDKFVIQGKDVKSLNLKEIIYLGLNTSINVPTQYKLSIPKLEGDFVTNQPIYLKDNKFNVYHNLSDSDYSFTAEPGEYNKRFEISFRDGSQPINNLNPNELVIFELNDGNVQFTINDDLTIKNITIIDILGRNIYNLKGSNYTETYNLSELSTSVYIAKVELSNGEVIIKKSIKKQ